MSSIFSFNPLNKRGGSGNVPREIYIFGIIIGYAIFGFLYVAAVNTYIELGNNTDCVLTNSDFTQIGGGEANGLFSHLITKITCLPQEAIWLNILIGIITILAITMFIIVLVHG